MSEAGVALLGLLHKKTEARRPLSIKRRRLTHSVNLRIKIFKITSFVVAQLLSVYKKNHSTVALGLAEFCLWFTLRIGSIAN